MDIKTVADILTDCANGMCYKCKYEGLPDCRDRIVTEMGAEVRKIAEEMEEQE